MKETNTAKKVTIQQYVQDSRFDFSIHEIWPCEEKGHYRVFLNDPTISTFELMNALSKWHGPDKSIDVLIEGSEETRRIWSWELDSEAFVAFAVLAHRLNSIVDSALTMTSLSSMFNKLMKFK